VYMRVSFCFVLILWWLGGFYFRLDTNLVVESVMPLVLKLCLASVIFLYYC